MDSIADQSTDYKVQVIVINDGSTDSTEAILEKYRCFSDWIIINQENRGFSGARNVGLDLAEGKYIMFVDSDDILGQNAIEKLMRKAIATDADIVAEIIYQYLLMERPDLKGVTIKKKKFLHVIIYMDSHGEKYINMNSFKIYVFQKVIGMKIVFLHK